MRPVKRVLLGSAAGLFAVAGAQAADLPIKAKPVEYVKVCSLYGAGFWYVPGTDTCIKIGAFAKLEANYGAGGGGNALGAGGTNAQGDFGGAYDRTTNMFNFRTRGAISFDMRQQTEYGTLRSYIDVGASVSTNGGGFAGSAVFQPLGPSSAFGTQAIFMDRAFIQFAGFTAGRMRSFFDMVFTGAYALAQQRFTGDSSPNGITGIAYTWQFGGGLSASFSLEDSGWGTGGHGRSTTNLAGGGAPPGESDANTPFGVGGTFFNDVKGQQFFDPVFNLRLDQNWGFVGASFALHDASGGYYGCAPPNGTTVPGNSPNNPPCSNGTVAGFPATTFPSLTTSGHPADKFGWAASLGFTLVNVFGMAGDSMGAQGVYSQGAIGYNTTNFGASSIYGSGYNVGLSYLVDGVYNSGTGVELTHNWSFEAYYEHVWNQKWRTSIYGGMLGTDFAGGKALICPNGAATPNPNGFTANAAGPGFTGNAIVTANSAFTSGGVNNCDPNSSWSQLGSRTLWNPVPDLDVGFDVSWVHLNTAFGGQANLPALGTIFQPAAGARPAGLYNVSNQDVLAAYFRIQRNFLY
jgi:Porin subfamily